MLKELTIKNFKSFNEEVLFTMEADTDRVSEFPNHVVNMNGNNLLKVASMYGPNGGGKSNVVQSLHLPIAVQRSIGFLDSEEIPCVFSKSNKIEETLFFVDEKYEMGYRLGIVPGEKEVEEIKGMPENFKIALQPFEIIEEQVVYRKKDTDNFILLFSRDDLGNIYSNYFDNLKDTKDFRLAKKKAVLSYMYETFADSDAKLPEYLDVIKHLKIQINKITKLDVLKDTTTNKKTESLIIKHKQSLISLLNDIDLKIKDIQVDEQRNNLIYFVREVMIDNEKCDREISLANESEGTKKIFWMLLLILENIEKGKIFLCDDMNAYLHPKLFRAVIKIFQNNEFGSQLIFNSHDILSMDNALFRRDEIWFAYRNENYSTQLVPLSNIVNYKGEQVRKDAKFHKQYLEGKYGADPFIKRGLNWNEN